MGDNQEGHPQYETIRTELGELLFQLKYRSDSKSLAGIVATAVHFIRSWKPDLTIVAAVPASKRRRHQPVVLIAEGIAEKLDIPFKRNAVRRILEVPELKGVYDYAERVRLLESAHEVNAKVVRDERVLLIDDLYRSGATMDSVARSLYNQGAASSVFALAITRTRTRT